MNDFYQATLQVVGAYYLVWSLLSATNYKLLLVVLRSIGEASASSSSFNFTVTRTAAISKQLVLYFYCYHDYS